MNKSTNRKIRNIYLDTLLSTVKIKIALLIICIIVFFSFNYIFNKLNNSKNCAEKAIATIVNINEKNNIHNYNENNREIESIEITFNYKETTYTLTTKNSYKSAKIGDTFYIYIMNNNPYDFIEEFSRNTNNIVIYILYGLLLSIFLILLLSIFITIKEIILYIDIEKDSYNVTANFIKIEHEKYYMKNKYYIICISNEIDGNERIFKSHAFNKNPIKIIEKYNINAFTIKYNPNDPTKYIIDTNKLYNKKTNKRR